MTKRDLRFSRRNLLRAVGAGAALLPLLEADRADALCLAGGIKRMYVLFWPEGMLSGITSWSTPGNDVASWALAPFQSSLLPYMSDLLLLDGVDYRFIRDMPGTGDRGGHACCPGLLTGKFYQTLSASTSADTAGGPSVDQYIGSTLKAGGYNGLVSLNQGVFVRSTGRLSWRAAGQVVLPNTDPYQIFNTYFAGAIPSPLMTSAPDGGASSTSINNSALTRKSILDYVMGDLKRFSNIVGTADKQAIDAHLTTVRQLELRLSSVGAVDGGSPGDDAGIGNVACNPPVLGTPVDINATANVPVLTKLQMDLGIAAFASDLTRCIVLQIGDQSGANLVPTWLGFVPAGPGLQYANTGDANGLHAIAHRNGAEKVVCDTWFQSQFAYLIGQLKSVVDVTGQSMLDNGVAVAMSNMRTGANETTGVPVMMAGGCGGYFKTGRSLALPAGTPNNGILVSLCNAMGTPVATFGEPMYGGELTVLRG